MGNWFGHSDYDGDWVFSVGGYHKQFAVPDHYPKPDRLGIRFSIGDNMTIGGEGYAPLVFKYESSVADISRLQLFCHHTQGCHGRVHDLCSTSCRPSLGPLERWIRRPVGVPSTALHRRPVCGCRRLLPRARTLHFRRHQRRHWSKFAHRRTELWRSCSVS